VRWEMSTYRGFEGVLLIGKSVINISGLLSKTRRGLNGKEPKKRISPSVVQILGRYATHFAGSRLGSTHTTPVERNGRFRSTSC
jgi:hypothetical protein